MPQFIQIATDDHGLYALDSSGQVWRYDEGDERWHKVPSARDSD